MSGLCAQIVNDILHAQTQFETQTWRSVVEGRGVKCSASFHCRPKLKTKDLRHELAEPLARGDCIVDLLSYDASERVARVLGQILFL